MEYIKGGNMKKAEKYYKEKIKNSLEIKKQLQKKCSVIAIVRLLLVAFIGGISYIFYSKQNYLEVFISLALGFIVFVIIAIYHGKIKNKIDRLDILIDLNEKGLMRINYEWKKFEDKGDEYIRENHAFTNDLDIFGQNSLFQWINSTVTSFGRKSLVDIISLRKSFLFGNIEDVQDAIKELAENIDWRQKLITDARIISKDVSDTRDLISWANTEMKVNFTMKYIPYIFLTITYSLIILCVLGKIPISLILLVLIMNYCAIKFLTKDYEKQIELFSNQKRNIYAYSVILEDIEEKEFKSNYLNKLKSNLKSQSYSCEKEMKDLKKLLDWVGDSKKNAYYFILNILTFSDVFIVCNLEKWRQKNGCKISDWLNIMGEFEALCSISNIPYENEEWTYPIVNTNYVFEGNDIGHPLLTSEAKCNDFKLNKNNVCLITGSNMSGKSTFLRTIGINMILAYIGAPVRGKNVKCGKYNIYTCMRTKDNLEERISSFYAEIMRIKKIVEAVRKGEKVFFLLDEIFKGTNSEDRHTGATVLIKQLQNSGAVGLVSTHDLDLCNLEKSYDWLKNYNFREYYENNEIKFDYVLRKGKSETRNAIHLMRLAGIKIQ